MYHHEVGLKSMLGTHRHRRVTSHTSFFKNLFLARTVRDYIQLEEHIFKAYFSVIQAKTEMLSCQ